MAATIMANGHEVTVTADYEAIKSFATGNLRPYAEFTALNGERLTIAAAAISGVAEVRATHKQKIGFAPPADE